jgi:hypothetical protein
LHKLQGHIFALKNDPIYTSNIFVQSLLGQEVGSYLNIRKRTFSAKGCVCHISKLKNDPKYKYFCGILFSAKGMGGGGVMFQRWKIISNILLIYPV